MREKLIEELIKEVYGPRNGALEEMDGDPLKEYVTGVIIPRKCKIKEDADPDSESTAPAGENFLAEDEASDEGFTAFTPSELDPKMRARSFGISFVVRGDEPSFKLCVTWGRYTREGNGNKKIWKRTPHLAIEHIIMDENMKKIPVYRGDDGEILIYIRKISLDGYQNIIVNLVNDLRTDKCRGRELTESSIFQPSIRIKMLDDTRLTQPEIDGDLLHFLYRNRPVLARGHMCSAVWKDIDYSDHIDSKVLWADGHHFDECHEFFTCDIRSEFVPLYPNPAPLFEWDDEFEREFGKPPELSAYRLSEMWEKDEVDRYLSPLTDAYGRWIEKNENIAHTLPDELKEMAFDLIENQKELLERMRTGIELLKNDDDVRLSFCFANRTIWLQHRWRGKGDFRWWPFQLAFIIMVLESLCNRDSEFREYIDLLWIPTGGGKTEAYLALMALIMALRRRRAGYEGNRTGGGTAVITRYTLRLLTIQQFRRTLRMVTAAEYLRVMETGRGRGWRPAKCKIDDDLIFGSLRFSVGMWVGGAVSPNHLRKNGGAMDALLGNEAEGEPAQVIRCPVCGTYFSVPKSGLPAGEKLFLVIRSDEKPDDIVDMILSRKDVMADLRDVTVRDHTPGYMTLILTLGDRKLTEKEIDDLWEKLRSLIPAEILSMRASRPGYFGCGSEPGRTRNLPRDFEIYCPNPDCELNDGVVHIEGVPLNPGDAQGERLPDGLVAKEAELPFSGSRIPVPACTVDEQIYHRCPTIIVSTADKIARLAFEPRATSIFGNVERYNAYYGYYRNGLLPYETTKRASADTNSTEVTPFTPPDLIVQDELHLMEGPLGSMFGLYENAVEGLIKIAGAGPKYIASTATIRDAEMQVRRLFARKLFQFPPYGIDIDDSFFVRYPEWDKGWDEERPGRVYMGIYSPGMGPLTPPIRIWSRLLKTCHDLRDDDNVKYFWTVVGYFNAIRELGGGRALFREDIIERLRYISSGNMRMLDPAKVVELSSRINSTDIPLILDELEAGGRKQFFENPDAIFTTSMFGTGVDIPHLSLMIVHGQPKTTSQYIQATGRVGRSHGGLIVTFLRAGRPRDLSHYEMFSAYHHRIYLEVEPSSVSPFSEGSLARASGPVLVSFLRNMPHASAEWYGEDGRVVLDPSASDDIRKFMKILSDRIARIAKNPDYVANYFSSQRDRWENTALKIRDTLEFVEYPHRTPRKNVVLGDPHHEKSNLEVVYRNAPQSLREIEETTGFEV